MHLSWLLLGSAAALRPQVTRRSLCGARRRSSLHRRIGARRRADRGAAPRAIYAGNDWIADRNSRSSRATPAAETAWRALGGAGAFEVLHKEKYTAGFKPTNEK